MTEESQYPLVTFALFAYNQEKYIREAVEGALAQDYPNLELIISDDASTDSTWEVVQSAVESYTGTKKLLLNRNARNLGLGAHVNSVVQIASGMLLIAAAGDDISHRDRTSVLVSEWLARGMPPAISSQARLISSNGEDLGQFSGYLGMYPRPSENRAVSISRLITKGECITLGCAAAWRRDVFEVFGPLSPHIIHEDNAISFRAWLLGSISFVDHVLVQYRQHGTNLANQSDSVIITAEGFMDRESKGVLRSERRIENINQHLADLQTAFDNGGFNDMPLARFREELQDRKVTEVIRAHWQSRSLVQRAQFLLRCIRTCDYYGLAWGVTRLFGFPFYCQIRQLGGRISRLLKLRSAFGKL